MPHETLDPAAIFGPDSPCFGCSPQHPTGLRLRFESDGTEVSTTFVPREDMQGPPGIVHGGLATTFADEIAAWTVIGLKQRFGFTASLAARLHRPLRVGLPVVGRGRIESDSPRVVKVHVVLSQEGAVAYTGEFTFVLLDERGAERLLGGPIPESWKKLARATK